VTDTALRLRQRSPASLAGGDGSGGAGEGGAGGGAEEEAVFNFPLMAKHRDAFVAFVAEVAAGRAGLLPRPARRARGPPPPGGHRRPRRQLGPDPSSTPVCI
jgi:hypothetical protein